MTKDKAIYLLRNTAWLAPSLEPVEEAVEMAVEALKERPRGKWRKITPEEDEYKSFMGWLECTNCRSEVAIFSNYCPNCGADMRGDEKE